MSERWLGILAIALALILPVSALMRRPVSWRKWIVLALIWSAVFLAVAILFDAAASHSVYALV